MLSIEKNWKSLVFLLITTLTEYCIIFGYFEYKKYTVFLDIINNSITISPEFCIHLRVFSSFITLKPIQKAKKYLKLNKKKVSLQTAV